MFRWLLFLSILNFSDLAEARKFDFKDGVFGAYIGGTIGTNRIQATPYGPAQPSTVSYPDYAGINYGYSGMFGLNVSLKNVLTFKLGGELFYAAKAKDIEGKNAAGTVLFSETSETLAVSPEFMVEVHVVKQSRLRASVGGGVQYMTAAIKNDVKMTAAGQAALGVGDYVEEGEGTAIGAKAFGAYEFLLVDNASVMFQLGYRYAVVKQFKYTRDAVLPAPLGAVSKGAVMRNVDGTNREVDLSGPFGGVLLTFWMW